MPICRGLLALLLLASIIRADDLSALGGKNLSGTVTSITPTEVVMKSDDGTTVATPMSQVLAIRMREVRPIEPGSKYIDVRLLDQTVIHCKDVEFQGKDLELSLFSGTKLKVSLNSIVSFLRDGQNQVQARKFDEIANQKLKIDRIVILNGEDFNVLKGTLGQVNAKDKTIEFKSLEVGKQVDIPIARLQGMVFYRPDSPTEIPVCKVYDVDGNMLIAAKLAHDGSKLTMTTTLGNQVTLPAEALARLDFNMGKLTYLSDMEPAKVVEKSGIGLVHHYRRDKNQDGQPITINGPFAKGLSMHAHTELEYNLGGKFKEFRAVAGVDVRTGAESQAKLTIYCDGVEVFSDVISAKNTRSLNINVKDVTTLRIVVGSGNILDLHDHASLGDARVSQ